MPRGTTDEDIYLGKPRLYTDEFYAYYTKSWVRAIFMLATHGYNEASRADVRKLLADIIDDIIRADERVTQVLMQKGIYNRPPRIPAPDRQRFMSKRSYLNDLFGRQPLTSHGITTLFTGMQANSVGKTLLLGFSQVTKDKAVKDYFDDGIRLASDFFREFSDVFRDENLTIPASLDSERTDSADPPFADRLMLNHVALITVYGMASYGAASSMSLRGDIVALFASVLARSANYAKDGADLLQTKGWLELPPLAAEERVLEPV